VIWVIGRSRMFLAGCAAATMCAPASAHHSFAMFDNNKHLSFKGVVSSFQYRNPHTYIVLDVAGPNGRTQQYTIECASVNMLSRAGWKPTSVKPGQAIKIDYVPLRNGDPGGLLEAATLPDGTVLKN